MFFADFLSKQTQRVNYRHLLEEDAYEKMLPVVEMTGGIPKNFYQACLRGNGSTADEVLESLPDSFRSNIRFLKENNPEYHYQMYSDVEVESFIRDIFGPKILSYYHRIDGDYLSSKADLFRYLLIYAQGGVYLDLKSSIAKPLDQVIREDDVYLLFYWDDRQGGQHYGLIPEYMTRGESLQGFIIAAKGHPFIRAMILDILKRIDLYNPFVDGVGWTGVMQTTGPALCTKTLYRLLQDPQNSSLYREGLPFKEFGYSVSFQGNYTPGEYQKRLSLRDYRKSARPVVRGRSSILQFANVCLLNVLSFYRKKILKKD